MRGPMQGGIEQVPDALEAETPEMGQHRLPRREVARQIAPGASCAQDVEGGVEDATRGVGSRPAAARQRREIALDTDPLRVSQVAWIRRTHAEQRTALRHVSAIAKHALTEKGQKAPRLQSGDEWPSPRSGFS